MNLSAIQYRLKNAKWDLILINLTVILFIVGIIFWFIQRNQGSTQPVPKAPLPSVEQLDPSIQFTYTGDLSLNRTTLPLLEVQIQQSPQEIIQRFQATYVLTESDFSPRVFLNPEGNITLSISKDSQYLDYYDSSHQLGSSTGDLSSWPQKAQVFLQELGFDMDQLMIVDQVYLAFSPGGEPDVTQIIGEADAVQVTYQPQYDAIPLAVSGIPTPGIILDITPTGILKARFTAYTYQVSAQEGEFQLLSISDAVNQLNQGAVTVLTQTLRTSFLNEDQEISSANLTDATLIYRINPEEGRALPYLDFSGTATLRNGDTSPILVTTPAIRTETIEVAATPLPILE